MASSRESIIDQPSSHELSFMVRSHEVSPTTPEHARHTSQSYPVGTPYDIGVTGAQHAQRYAHKEIPVESDLYPGLPPHTGPGGGLPGFGPKGATPRRGSRSGMIVTTQPGYPDAGSRQSGSTLSEYACAEDAVFARSMKLLAQHDVIRIQQRMRLDLKAGCGSGNSYEISSVDTKETLFNIAEDSNCCCRWLCGPARMSHMTVYTLEDEEILHLDRACCRCDCCCCINCCCCQHKLTIRDTRGRVVGTVKEKFHIFHLKLHLLAADGKVAMQVFGPCCPFRCCSELTFDIMNAVGLKELGYILKKWDDKTPSADSPENTDHENIEITMPQHLQAEERVLIIGAAMLSNLMYMEMS